MSETEQPLPLTLPLTGARLIEASAGTGKTFTLAALYVRLVLRHGGENAFARALMPPEILVVTFTEAATRELRDRIRNRLAEAARYFRGQEDGDEADPFIAGLLGDYDDTEHPACADLLDAAAQWMDEAAVYTIHSFCNRMLREHAFDSGSLFDLELNQDDEPVLEDAARDYWRTFCYPLNEREAETLKAIATTPDELLAEVRPLLTPDARALEESAEDILRRVTDEREHRLEAAKDFWREQIPDLIEKFETAWNEKRLPRSKPSNSKTVLGWLDKVARWASGDETIVPELTDTAFERLRPEEVARHGDNLDELVRHPALHHFRDLRNLEAELPKLTPQLLPHASAWIAGRVQQHKRRQGVIGFDDMLTRLRDALHGDNGDKLAHIIREQFPVALIDEFQDTDPVQYAIFHRIYAKQPEVGWFMIGDPKQAIYSFRGADIFTYLQARDAVGRKRHSLAYNFRSSPALVEAVNQVFGAAEARNPEGAFLLNHSIPFDPVASGTTAQRYLEIDGREQAALTFWLLFQDPETGQTSLPKGDYQQQMAAACASQMTQLLNQGHEGKARFRDEKNEPVRSADMAVLVRTGREAEAIRSELDRRGVRSVYLSDKDNVLNTGEASDVLLWLLACAEPESESALRAALATATLGLSWQQLDELGHYERRWEDKLEQFRGYRARWRRQGVLAMLRNLMRDHDVPARLMRTEGGERALTNLLHLSELLQQAATQLDGEQALIRWLAEEREAAAQSPASDEQILRLESDADLVKVITIHKAKGLEYPLVFLPFVCDFRPVHPKDRPLRYHDQDGVLQLSLDPDDVILAQAERERLAEDTRLLYVALTRAKYACWLGMAPLRSGGGKDRMDLHQSAVGTLLGIEADDQVDQLQEKLNHHAQASEAIRLTPAPEITTDTLRAPQAENKKLGPARSFQGIPLERWWVASYSALQHEAGRQTPPDSARDEDYLEEERATARATATGHPLHAFMSGPMAGTFLHGLLEVLADLRFDAGCPDEGEFADALHQRLAVRRWEDWHQPLHEWMRSLVETPLPLGQTEVALNQLRSNAFRPELEFLFPVHQVPAAELDRVIRAHVLPGAERPSLAGEHLNGMLKGFIDLVFEHDGRYYVMDYKSNRLGDDDGAYTETAMRATVLEKRYEVQYSLYLFALHRLLKTRLGEGYDYDRHIGGSAYYFLRGIHAQSRGLFFERPPKALMDDMDALFRGEMTSHA